MTTPDRRPEIVRDHARDLPRGIHLNIHSRGSSEHTALLIHGWAVCSDIVALIDHLVLRNIVLVGHSMGGAIAMKVALARPQSLRKPLLISPVPAAFFRSLGGSQAGSEQVLGMMMASRPSPTAYERAVVGMGSVAELECTDHLSARLRAVIDEE